MTVTIPPTVLDPEAFRRTVDEVLRQPEFEEARPGLVVRAVAWVFNVLADVLTSLQGGSGWSAVAGWLVIGLLLAGSTVGVIRWTAGMRRDPGIGEVGTAGPDPELWRRRAAEAALAGDHDEAVRCEHRALVAELQVRRLVEVGPGRTAREIARAVERAAPGAAADAAALARLFEQARYGDGVDPDAPQRAHDHRVGVEAVL